MQVKTAGGAEVVRQASESFRIDVDLEHARSEGDRVLEMLQALRHRHDLCRYEYTRVVRIIPASETYSHPILTLGNRFAHSEDLLLSTYLHEQMHWYLWYLHTPEQDPVAPFFDELVKRYPDAPIELPDGARNYESTYLHLVINWLEVAVTSEYIGRRRAAATVEGQSTYRWIYRTVMRDWDALAELYERHGLVPIRPAAELRAENAESKEEINGAARKSRAKARPPPSRKSRRKPRARGGRSTG